MVESNENGSIDQEWTLLSIISILVEVFLLCICASSFVICILGELVIRRIRSRKSKKTSPSDETDEDKELLQVGEDVNECHSVVSEEQSLPEEELATEPTERERITNDLTETSKSSPKILDDDEKGFYGSCNMYSVLFLWNYPKASMIILLIFRFVCMIFGITLAIVNGITDIRRGTFLSNLSLLSYVTLYLFCFYYILSTILTLFHVIRIFCCRNDNNAPESQERRRDRKISKFCFCCCDRFVLLVFETTIVMNIIEPLRFLFYQQYPFGFGSVLDHGITPFLVVLEAVVLYRVYFPIHHISWTSVYPWGYVLFVNVMVKSRLIDAYPYHDEMAVDRNDYAFLIIIGIGLGISILFVVVSFVLYLRKLCLFCCIKISNKICVF